MEAKKSHSGKETPLKHPLKTYILFVTKQKGVKKELLSVEHIYHIRYEHRVNGKSLRPLARETGHDVKTITKYVKTENFSQEMPKKKSRKSKADQYRQTIKEWLEADETAPKKQRSTARNIYKRLVKKLASEGGMLVIRSGNICP